MKVRRKPLVVDVEQFLPPDFIPKGVQLHGPGPGGKLVATVVTVNGEVNVNEGDWIFPESDGEHFYPCPPADFVRKYEFEDPAGFRDGIITTADNRISWKERALLFLGWTYHQRFEVETQFVVGRLGSKPVRTWFAPPTWWTWFGWQDGAADGRRRRGSGSGGIMNLGQVARLLEPLWRRARPAEGPATHDYTRCLGPGHDYFVQQAGNELKAGGWGRDIQLGDYLLLCLNKPDPEPSTRYEVVAIEYCADPSDLWFATLRFAPRST